MPACALFVVYCASAIYRTDIEDEDVRVASLENATAALGLSKDWAGTQSSDSSSHIAFDRVEREGCATETSTQLSLLADRDELFDRLSTALKHAYGENFVIVRGSCHQDLWTASHFGQDMWEQQVRYGYEVITIIGKGPFPYTLKGVIAYDFDAAEKLCKVQLLETTLPGLGTFLTLVALLDGVLQGCLQACLQRAGQCSDSERQKADNFYEKLGFADQDHQHSIARFVRSVTNLRNMQLNELTFRKVQSIAAQVAVETRPEYEEYKGGLSILTKYDTAVE